MLIQLLIIQIITFIALVLVLRALFHRNLNIALHRLRTLQEENLIKEEMLKNELERAKAERLAEIEKGKQQARVIVEKAKKEAIDLKESMEEKAKQESERILVQTKSELEKLRQSLIGEMEKKAVDLSVQMIKLTFTTQGMVGLQQQMIDEVIEEISNLSKDKFSVATGKVKCICAFALSESKRDNLKRVLLEKMDSSEVVLEEEVNPELIAGLLLEIGSLVIDGSLKSRLRRAIPALHLT